MQNLKKTWFVVSKMTRIWSIMTRAPKTFKNLHFDWFLLCKVYNVWGKRVMKLKNDAELEEKLTSALENDMRNLANFHQSTWKCQKWDFDVILLSKLEDLCAEIYREFMCNDTEEWWNIWRGIDLSFQNWHEEFDEFWHDHSKVSKTCTLIGSFARIYIMFELKKYRGIIFHDTEGWCK